MVNKSTLFLSVVLAALLFGGAGYWLGARPDAVESKYSQAERDSAETEAGYYCSMTSAGAEGIYSEMFKNCVEDQTEINLKNPE